MVACELSVVRSVVGLLSTSRLYKESGAATVVLRKETLGKEMPCARRLGKERALTPGTSSNFSSASTVTKF